MTFFLRELTTAELDRVKRAEAKRERRDLRKRLMAAARKHLSTGFKLTHSAAQEKAAARTITDQLLAGKNPGLVEMLP